MPVRDDEPAALAPPCPIVAARHVVARGGFGEEVQPVGIAGILVLELSLVGSLYVLALLLDGMKRSFYE